MKILTFIVLIVCISLTLSLKPREQAHVLLSGRIGGPVGHELRKQGQHQVQRANTEHNLEKQNQHELFGHSHSRSHNQEDGARNHERQEDHDLFGHSSSHSHNLEDAAHDKMDRQHELFGHSSSSSSSSRRFHDQADQQHQKMDRQHDYDSTTTTSTSSYRENREYYAHDAQKPQGVMNRHHDDEQHDEFSNDQDDKTAKKSRNYVRITETKQLYITGKDVLEEPKQEKKTHKTGKHDLSHKQNDEDEPNKGEVTYDDRTGAPDNTNFFNTNNDQGNKYGTNIPQQAGPSYTDTSRNYNPSGSMSGTTSGGQYYHKQNNRDEPDNGDRYYYVNDADITKAMRDEDTSSFSSINLKNYVDYNKDPINFPQRSREADTDSTSDTTEQTTGKVYYDNAPLYPHTLPPVTQVTTTTYPAAHQQTTKKYWEDQETTSDSSPSVRLHNPNDDQYLIKHPHHQTEPTQTHPDMEGSHPENQADHEKLMLNKNKFQINHQKQQLNTPQSQPSHQLKHETQPAVQNANAGTEDNNQDQQANNNVNDQYNNSPLYTHDKSLKHQRRNHIQ